MPHHVDRAFILTKKLFLEVLHWVLHVVGHRVLSFPPFKVDLVDISKRDFTPAIFFLFPSRIIDSFGSE